MDGEALEDVLPLHQGEAGIVDGLLEVMGPGVAYQRELIWTVIDVDQDLEEEVVRQVRVAPPP